MYDTAKRVIKTRELVILRGCADWSSLFTGIIVRFSHLRGHFQCQRIENSSILSQLENVPIEIKRADA